jgi:hypothetical protein
MALLHRAFHQEIKRCAMELRKHGKLPKPMNQQKAINDLCARMFREPERLVSVFAARLHAPLCLPVHQHRDLLQLDLAVGCSGNWPGSKAAVTPSGVTAVVFYTRAPHGYELITTTQIAAPFSI